MKKSELSERYLKACTALSDAIQEHRDAFLEMCECEHPQTPEVLTDWAVIAAYLGYDEGGDQTTAYHVVLPDDQMPEHRLRGLWLQGVSMMDERK